MFRVDGEKQYNGADESVGTCKTDSTSIAQDALFSTMIWNLSVKFGTWAPASLNSVSVQCPRSYKRIQHLEIWKRTSSLQASISCSCRHRHNLKVVAPQFDACEWQAALRADGHTAAVNVNVPTWMTRLQLSALTRRWFLRASWSAALWTCTNVAFPARTEGACDGDRRAVVRSFLLDFDSGL